MQLGKVFRDGPEDLSNVHRLVLLALADHANPHGVCDPSHAGLTAWTGLGRSTVVRTLSELEGAGWVGRTVRTLPGTQRKARTLYALNVGRIQAAVAAYFAARASIAAVVPERDYHEAPVVPQRALVVPQRASDSPAAGHEGPSQDPMEGRDRARAPAGFEGSPSASPRAWPELVARASQLWPPAYAKRYGRHPVESPGEMARLCERLEPIVAAHCARLGVPPPPSPEALELGAQLVAHQLGEHIRSSGRNNYLLTVKHRLAELVDDVEIHGTPWRLRAPAPAPEVAPPASGVVRARRAPAPGVPPPADFREAFRKRQDDQAPPEVLAALDTLNAELELDELGEAAAS